MICPMDPLPHKTIIDTEYVTDLDQRTEMIILEPFLASFESSIIFEASGAVVKTTSSLKPYHHKQV